MNRINWITENESRAVYSIHQIGLNEQLILNPENPVQFSVVVHVCRRLLGFCNFAGFFENVG
jgi:hypothetical protein